MVDDAISSSAIIKIIFKFLVARYSQKNSQRLERDKKVKTTFFLFKKKVLFIQIIK